MPFFFCFITTLPPALQQQFPSMPTRWMCLTQPTNPGRVELLEAACSAKALLLLCYYRYVVSVIYYHAWYTIHTVSCRTCITPILIYCIISCLWKAYGIHTVTGISLDLFSLGYQRANRSRLIPVTEHVSCRTYITQVPHQPYYSK